MAAEIRCPHCRRRLLAEDFTSGELRECPVCHQEFTVPAFAKEAEVAAVGGKSCPRCSTEAAAGTQICQKCLTDFATGRRIPWSQRVARLGVAHWTLRGAVGAALILGGILGWHFYDLRFRNGHSPVVAEPHASIADPADTEALASRLVRATTVAAGRSALESLRLLGPPVEPVGAALTAALDKGQVQPAGGRVAARVLAESGDDRWKELLLRLGRLESLRTVALAGRARLGDGAVAADLQRGWVAALQRQMFAAAYVESGLLADPAARAALLRRESEALDEWMMAMRWLGADPAHGVLEAAAGRYWDSWGWLGQGAGERFAESVFLVAQPGDVPGVRFEKEEIRAARRALDAAAQRAKNDEIAALAIVLVHCAPQYQSARERLTRATGAALGRAAPLAQQRMTWALARLTGRDFGETNVRGHPARVSAGDVQLAIDWAAQSAGGSPARAAPPQSYRTARTLTCRIVTPQRQLEAALIEQMRTGWTEMHLARERWLASELPWSVRIDAMLAPGQRAPQPAALAGAMILAADLDVRSVRPALRLWRDAEDQPGWVRGLAQLTLASLDARAGELRADWGNGLQAAWLTALPAGLETRHLGRVLTAGGPALHTSIRRDESLPAAVRSTLLAAMEQALRAQVSRH